ncbi:uncharacterized protein [Ptychodera flava]|uniref:uncharacterized protein n=1 Tax=Ptychodera flava TaxID=63121 RepID=UPI00396A4FA4
MTSLAQGICLCAVTGLLHSGVAEILVTAMVTVMYRVRDKHSIAMADYSRLTLIMAYNLLAGSKSEIEETFSRMYQAFVGNLSENISAVLISATSNEQFYEHELEMCKYHREIIYKVLLEESICYALDRESLVDEKRLCLFWRKFSKSYVWTNAKEICRTRSNEFMVVHRVSRVLRKCGQYQDLMLLSEGDDKAYTYTDKKLYGTMARRYGEPLFYSSNDVLNIRGRRFDYTLVLDGDTTVVPGLAHELLAIASANLQRGIIQPAIAMEVTSGDTLFMQLEKIRQQVNADIAHSMSEVLGQCGFFGKALIKNKIYIEKVIGYRDNLIEMVPVDILSHDTFEAAILKPLYAGNTYLLESPCFNYVTWNIRERRWNKGEILLGGYFWPTLVGKPMRWLRMRLEKDKYVDTRLRTVCHFDFISAIVSHSALRVMFMKPLLLVYLALQYNVQARHPFLSLAAVMLLVVLIPKIAILKWNNIHLVLVETLCAILQFTPETVVGTVRLMSAIKANLSKTNTWIPQRTVEEDFMKSNVFISSFKYLWGYSVFSAAVMMIIFLLKSRDLWILSLLFSLLTLPLFTAVTALRPYAKNTESNAVTA